MNSNYLNEYINYFDKALSVAHKKNYSLKALERAISYSPFFQQVEKDNEFGAPIINDFTIIKSLFPELDVDLNDLPSFNETLWMAESYLRIQHEFGLTFEAIFLYCPIYQMFSYFELYHEMDFSQLMKQFNNLVESKSIFAILLEKFNYSINYVSKKTAIPYATLSSLKTRRRDIKKMNVFHIAKIANVFNVRIETIAELQLG